ncbi:MAG: hypothetical protein QOE33_100 [Acidobacteriota bacterium]|nr:hypothetical protein [Acidobacteriota bacterium]
MWSIGIYTGESPFSLGACDGARNPVLTRESVSDVPAAFVADPFMLWVGAVWYMFFEVLNRQTNKGEIGLATSSDGLHWTYKQIILAEPFHLSYPYVFEWGGEYYMTPETLGAGAVRLYKAEDFPARWSHVGTLIEASCADPSVFRFDGKWWMFACSTPYQHDTLRLYFAEELTGEWVEHAAGPIVEGDKRKARPGGRVLVSGDRVIRFAQDCVPAYGTQLRAFEIYELTADSYAEKEHPGSPVLQPSAGGGGWNAQGMHHVDPHQTSDGSWIACVDGFGVCDE